MGRSDQDCRRNRESGRMGLRYLGAVHITPSRRSCRRARSNCQVIFIRGHTTELCDLSKLQPPSSAAAADVCFLSEYRNIFLTLRELSALSLICVTGSYFLIVRLISRPRDGIFGLTRIPARKLGLWSGSPASVSRNVFQFQARAVCDVRARAQLRPPKSARWLGNGCFSRKI